MEKTVVVINDELGGMAYAFQRAGFKVLCDIVLNEESIEIAKKNLQDELSIQICKLPDEAYMELPEASILVGRIWSNHSFITKYIDWASENYYQYVKRYTPEVFCIEALKGFIASKQLREWKEWCYNQGYKVYMKVLKTGDVTGLPVREERLYIVGCKNDAEFDFFHNKEKALIPWEEILDEETEDSFRKTGKIKYLDFKGDGIYDWEGNGYQKSETVRISSRYPLLVKGDAMRYLSNREIARLKGYPDEYDFTGIGKLKVKNCLCSSANVIMCYLLAEQIRKVFFEEYKDNRMEKDEKKIHSVPEIAGIKAYSASKTEGEEMERRFDVFVSSTYEDLIEERKEITQAVLECDCMPVGMEMFPASNLEQWEFIKRVIDKADIYLVVIAGKYGTVGRDESGNRMSYTEMEFNYALASGKPILAFQYKDINNLPRNKVELDEEKREALEVFRKKVQKGRIVKFYSNKDELKANVLGSLNSIKKQITTGGWIREKQASFNGKKELEEKVQKLEGNQEKLLLEKRKLEEEREKILRQLNEVKASWVMSQEKENMLKEKYENAKLKVNEFGKKVDMMKVELERLSEQMKEL